MIIYNIGIHPSILTTAVTKFSANFSVSFNVDFLGKGMGCCLRKRGDGTGVTSLLLKLRPTDATDFHIFI
jgi:hypothetical protein